MNITASEMDMTMSMSISKQCLTTYSSSLKGFEKSTQNITL